jgi:peptidoglycan/LPS O-acetylase OafA/YrhL
MKSLNIPYNPRIDQLRWLAAAVVFFYHFEQEIRILGGPGLAGSWWGIITQGHTGVGLFFTLSGFLFMQIALHQGTIIYKDFVRNRFLRIFPLFFTIFLLATSIGRDTFQPQDILYLLTTNLGLAPTSGTLVTGAAWTISLEFMFYLIFPFLARFTMEKGARYLLGLLGLMVFFKLAAYTVNAKPALMYFSTWVGRFDQFLIGMLAALLYREHRDALHRWSPMLLPICAAIVVASSALLAHVAPFHPESKSQFWIFWSMIEASAWTCLILAWVSFDRQLPAWLDKVLCHGGKISFSFYLLHMGVLHLLGQRFGLPVLSGNPMLDVAVLLALTYAITWAVATLCYNLIEEPFLNMRRRYGASA